MNDKIIYYLVDDLVEAAIFPSKEYSAIKGANGPQHANIVGGQVK